MITGLYLYNYLPFSFSGIKEVTYKPEKIMQVIVGTNGSGKTSLLKALSPICLEANLFLENGIRILEEVTNGSHYKMVSNYSGKSPKHEFWKDGVNLNLGGTTTVQNDLVQEHLNYGKFQHMVLTGKLKFSRMTLQQRKELLIYISNLDMDWGLKLFDRVKKDYNLTAGAIKHVVSKYDELSRELACIDGTEDLAEMAKALELEVAKQTQYTNFGVNVPLLKSKVSDLYKTIQTLTEQNQQRKARIMKWRRASPKLFRFEDVEAFQREIIVKETLSQDIDRQIAMVKESLEASNETVKKMRDLPKEDLDLDKYRNEMSAILETFPDLLDKPKTLATPDIDNYIYEIDVLRNELNNMSAETESTDYAFTKEDIEDLRARRVNINDQLAYNTKRKDYLEEKIHHAKLASDSNVKCTNCGHVMLAADALTPEALKDYEGKYTAYCLKVDELKKADAKLTQEEHYLSRFQSAMDHLKGLVNKFPALREQWKEIGQPAEIALNPYMAANHFMEHRRLALQEKARRDAYVAYNNASALLELAELKQSSSILKQFEENEARLDELYTKKEAMTKWINNVSLMRKVIADFLETTKLLNEKYLPELEKALQDLTTGCLDDAVNNAVLTKQSQLGKMRITLDKYNLLRKQLEDLKKDEVKIQEERDILFLLMDSLSPTTGLIAQQLRAVMTHVITKLNHFIGEVWEIDLTLNVPDEHKKLDFSFPTTINTIKGPDIRDLSMGQCEIVDLAMTLVVMRQMQLMERPLFLDETGANFDPKHKANLMEFILRQLESGSVESIFMISHYAVEYGCFTNADVITLNTDNIGIPEGEYNRCIEIK